MYRPKKEKQGKENANVKRRPFSAGRVNVTSGVHCGMKKDRVARPLLYLFCSLSSSECDWL